MLGQPISSSPVQLSLWKSVVDVYLSAGNTEVSNEQMYRAAAQKTGVSVEEFSRTVPIGKSGTSHSPKARTARWVQQTLKIRGIIEKVPNKRGFWRLTNEAKTKLHRVDSGYVIVGFSTKLGLALWADCRNALSGLEEQIHLVLTSPPFLLNRPRAYGQPAGVIEYIDFICSCIEALMPKLARGASVCINLSNDTFEPGLPSRQLINERLILALHDRFGLHLMDRLVWSNPSKPPGPVQWSSIRRFQLNSGFEHIYWFSAQPHDTFADNRRVLQPHTDRQLKLISRGGETREASYSDGRYNLKPGRFSNPTTGRIPRNLLMYGHHCTDQRHYKKAAKGLGLPAHGAPWPLSLVDFLIRYLTAEGMLVADPFGGSMSTAVACERLHRRWISTEINAEYLVGGSTRFAESWINPDVCRLLGLEPSAVVSARRH